MLLSTAKVIFEAHMELTRRTSKIRQGLPRQFAARVMCCSPPAAPVGAAVLAYKRMRPPTEATYSREPSELSAAWHKHSGSRSPFDASSKMRTAIVSRTIDEGTIVRIFMKPGEDPNVVCDKCKDDRRGKPWLGLDIIRGMKRNGAEYTNGTILDPRDGDLYSAMMTLTPDGQRADRVRRLPDGR